MPNRLADETSPYLLQHKDNPVDWYPWGDEALSRARSEDKPILVSIGYSACHWCHVMERESFENGEIARQMNESFVCIKVDREERPDVDDLYMEAVQAMTGQGGWPLTAFLDPEGVPFHGGTYFPPEPRQGMPSFPQVMEAVIDAYRNRRDEIEQASGPVREGLGAVGRLEAPEQELSEAMIEAAMQRLQGAADPENGGFGGAPKFPPASALEFLFAAGAGGKQRPGAAGPLSHAKATLDRMAGGGIYDQIGGGFARYATDAAWLVPHFEKMLYDNALLARTYLHGFQVFGEELHKRVCVETLDWALREMRGPEGGFYSALDADSEGEEGRFYVWTEDEMVEVLEQTELADATVQRLLGYWGVNPRGNFEGKSILYVAAIRGSSEPPGIEEARQALLTRRETRVRPGLDDKRLAAWNALMIAALADAGAVLGREDYLQAARECATFVLEQMHDDEGRLLRTYKDGSARITGYLEDHAFLAEALLVLYEATFEERWYTAAKQTADAMIERFADAERGGFFTTAADAEELIARRKDLGDHPIPSGNSAAALALLRLSALSGEHSYAEIADRVLALFAGVAAENPPSFGHMLTALDFRLSKTQELALCGGDLTPFTAAVNSKLHPHLVRAGGPEGTTEPPLMRERREVDGKATAYVCEDFACQAPVTDPAALGEALA